MKLRDLTFALFAGLLLAGAATAQDAKPGDRPMSGEQKAAMETWARFATPGEGHKALAGMVGTWDAEVTSWMDPGQPPMKSKGTSENRMVLGGRWVESKFTSEMMGQPFEGLGYTGYDNYKKKYIGTWQDNMSTAVMVSEGTMDAGGKVMTSTSTMDDVVTGKKSTVKMTTTIVDPDHHVFEMWGPDPSGKNVKQMEIRYTRRK
jgi:uncharacterized protein DUF1579